MTVQLSYSAILIEAWNSSPDEIGDPEVDFEPEPEPRYERCNACKGSGIDPRSDHLGSEWDCMQCQGYGDIELFD